MALFVVTGGAGFIGCNLVRALLAAGHTVRVIDNLYSGKLANLADIASEIEFFEEDIRNLSAIQKIIAGADYVLHQAAIRAVERSVDNPQETNDVNISGTLNVLIAARDANVKRIVLASSSSVYGDVTAERNVETLPLQPASPYALTKATGEQYARLFTNLYGLSTVSLRYFNVFGPHQDASSKYSNVLPLFAQALLENRTPVIHWNGDQSRDFTYIDNVVQANLKAALSVNVVSGEAYNVGTGMTTSINELYQQIQDLLNIHMEATYQPKRAGDVLRTHADIEKARRDFDYEPTVSFADGLATSVKWYKENIHTAVGAR